MLEAIKSASGRNPLEVAQEAVRRAGAIIMDRFCTEMAIDYKGRGNITTEVDYLVEAEVVKLLRQEFPGFSVIAEESDPVVQAASEYTWIFDPLDGSRNYASGMPIFSVNLALAKGDQPVLALTYDPTRDELFQAVAGSQTTLNGQPVSVTRESTLHDSIIGIDMGYDNDMAQELLEMVTGLWPGMQSIRIVGSAALGLAYAACGRIDIYIHHLLYTWDVAPGILLVRQAGGVVTERDGSPVTVNTPGIIASNAQVHADFMRLTEGYAWRRMGGK